MVRLSSRVSLDSLKLAALCMWVAFMATVAAPALSAEDPGALEERVRRAALATYIHGMTEEIALAEVGTEGVPVLRRLLADREFPRRDNVVAFLAFLGASEESRALLAMLAIPPASGSRPEEERALLLAPQALGQIASRGEPLALEALLDMTADDSRENLRERAATFARDPDAFTDNLLNMALRGLAYAGVPEAESRLVSIARGRTRPAGLGRPLTMAAWSALDLRNELRSPRARPAEAGPGEGGEEPEVSASVGSGSLDAQALAHDSALTYANHVDVSDPMTDSRLDVVLAEASFRAGRGDDPADVACCATVSRTGSALTFGAPADGYDTIDDGDEMVAMLSEPTARVKVVTAINYCGGPGTNIIGCAWIGGNGMILVRLTDPGFEALLWLHEYGHNTGLNHNNTSISYIMYGVNNGQNTMLTQPECDAFHTPSPGTAMTPVALGACTDGDADVVHDVIDNCPTVANFDQVDTDGDGVGDACASTDCGNGVQEGAEDCDGGDLGGETCTSQGFAGGDLSCQLDCTFDTSACTCPDGDGDGVCDGVDNCPNASNTGQADVDADGQGDACDTCPNDPDNDADADGVCGDVDNCPATSNAGQADGDGDGLGDACDACPNDPANDTDGDGICDGVDNCPGTVNPTQADADGDGAGDACDPCPVDFPNDTDGDGACDSSDNCPATPNAGQADGDGDGLGDLCDPCPADPDNDLDGDGVCGDQDGHPDDPDRTGPTSAGTAGTVDHNWQTVPLPSVYQDPVVIAGPPSYNGSDPGVAQVQAVGSSGFDLRFAEWEYLDGSHWKQESIPYIVLEKGRYTMDDGSIWEAGSFSLSGTQSWSFKRFSQPFAGNPQVFLTAQTANGEPVTVRARNVKNDGFGASLFEEEALMDGHPTEEVGYLAIYSPAGSGEVTVDGVLTPYLLQATTVDRRFVPFLGFSVKLEEDRSADSENWHKDETVALLGLGARLWAQGVSWEGVDTFSLRCIDPLSSSVAVEWGTLDDVDHGWKLVPLAKSYVDPVIVVKPASYVDSDPGALRIRNIDEDSFEVRFEEWSYLDGNHMGERVFYIVAEAGQHDLGGLALEAGKLDTNKVLGPGGWKQVGFGTAFSSAPAVFASLQTVNEADPVVTRVKQLSASNFKLTMQEEEAGGGHALETVGWIAVQTGTAQVEGHDIEVLMNAADHQPGSFGFAQPFGRRFPLMITDVTTTGEEDTCSPRFESMNHLGATVMLQEEQSGDAEMAHATEDLSVFLAE